MLQIIKIQHVPFLFCRPVFIIKPFCQLQQLVYHHPGPPDAFHHLMGALGTVKLPASAQGLLDPVAAGRDKGFLVPVNLLTADGSQTVKTHINKTLVQLFIPAFTSSGPDCLDFHPVTHKHGLVCQWSVFLPAHLKGPIQLPAKFFHLPGRILKQEPHPGAFLHLLQILFIQLLPAFFKPKERPWMALGELPCLKYHILDSLVGLPAAKVFHETGKCLIAFLITGFQHFPHHIPP